MKTQHIIIAVIAILVVAGIAFGVIYATKSDSGGTTVNNYASNSNPLRSGSLLDRLKAEQEAGMYGAKKESEATQEGQA